MRFHGINIQAIQRKCQVVKGRLVGNISGVASRRLPTRFYATKQRDFSPGGLAALKAGGLTFLPPSEIDLSEYLETDAVYSNRLKSDLADGTGWSGRTSGGCS